MNKVDREALARKFRDNISGRGMKATPQRAAIYEELLKAKDHPSAEAVYRRVRKILPNISFDTVYRTLISFSEREIINIVEGYGENKRFEPNTESHHHFRCLKCHEITDFRNSDYDAIKIPDEFGKKFKVSNKRVVLEGVCPGCMKRA